jgi:hypothetical protein
MLLAAELAAVLHLLTSKFFDFFPRNALVCFSTVREIMRFLLLQSEF